MSEFRTAKVLRFKRFGSTGAELCREKDGSHSVKAFCYTPQTDATLRLLTKKIPCKSAEEAESVFTEIKGKQDVFQIVGI